ncbi:hypothetical protein JYA63_15960 [Fictibacillus nanhaiensis]|uniref:Histidine kinase n=1 Tax=Fictibacillus nanhaiensis TaxID=742169 RepID=A0ABS2ZSD7_9BACL|nr:hypothetical protein [Fictibacillus nanhaiensis]
MLSIRIILYSFVVSFMLFVSTIVLPDYFDFNERISKWIFIITVSIIFLIVKEKWWIKIISAFLGIIVCIVLFVL